MSKSAFSRIINFISYIGLSILICIISYPTIYGGKTQEKSYTVKVLIGEHVPTLRVSKTATWTLTSNTGFLLYNPAQETDWHTIQQKTITVAHNKTQLLINGTPYKSETLRIMPKDGFAGIDGNQFHGSFSIAQMRGRTYLINHVDLEEYVYSVLKTESWPGWPVEVNKAFAIASRSYVIAMIQQMYNSSLPYHVKNTNEHQTYQGMHNTNTIRSAVEQTKGMVLLHNNRPALAMFDSCCGGVIPAHIDDFDFEKAPYLKRTYACTHCARCKIHSWEKKIHISDLNKQLKRMIEFPGLIHHITITQKDKAGLVTHLHMKDGKNSHTVSGKQFYSALKDIKSFCYTMHKKADTLIISGKGYGHHLGMCQWGAREMVRDGWPYKTILAFYYPGTHIKKMV